MEILVYLFCGSGEEQKWNKIEENGGESQPLKEQNDQKKPESV